MLLTEVGLNLNWIEKDCVVVLLWLTRSPLDLELLGSTPVLEKYMEQNFLL